MKWPDILKVAEQRVEELRAARKKGKYECDVTDKWGRSCVFFPITQNVGVKIYVKHWGKNFKDSLMFTTTMASEKMAPPVFYSKEYDDYGIMIVGIGEYLPNEKRFAEDIEADLMRQFHTRLNKMLRFIKGRWGYFPEFAKDYSEKNFGLYCGKLVYLDCNVDN